MMSELFELGSRGSVGQLWDDKYLLVVAYVLSVTLSLRFGPFKQGSRDSQGKKVAAKDWSKSQKIWHPIILGYNILMSIFSFFCFSAMSYVLVVKMDGHFGGEDCTLFDRDALFRQIVYLFYLSKYVEFADTLFLLVKGKEVSWLHFFHHCGAAVNMGMLHKSGMEAAFIFVMLNGFVHTVMYAYYALSLVGVRIRGKLMITTMQIVQFLTGFSIFWQYQRIPCFRESKPLMTTFWFTYAYVGAVLLFFLNFYMKSMAKTKTA